MSSICSSFFLSSRPSGAHSFQAYFPHRHSLPSHTARNLPNNGRCGSAYSAHTLRGGLVGRLPAEGLPQMYRAFYRNPLAHRELQGLLRFTCEGESRVHHSEKGLWGMLASGDFPQVYSTFCRNTLEHKELQGLCEFTCGGGRRAYRGESAV